MKWILLFSLACSNAVAKESFIFKGPPSDSKVEFECVSEKRKVAKRISRWLERKADEGGAIVRSNTEIDGAFDNSKERYLWQVFTFSFLFMETKEDRMVATVLGSIPPNLNKFTVGDVYKYELQSKNTRKSDGHHWLSRSAHELSVQKPKKILWHNQKELVFLVKDTLKQTHPPLEKTMIHYFSAKRNVTLKSEITVSDGQRNTCTLKKLP